MQNNRLLLTAQHGNFSLKAMLVPVPDGWNVSGLLMRTGPQACVSLRFGLPVNPDGWVLWDTIASAFPLQADVDQRAEHYLITIDPGAVVRRGEAMPYTAISSNLGSFGFAAALDRQVVRYALSRRPAGLFAVDFPMALLDGQKNFERSMPFSFYLLSPRVGGWWGLRSVISAYYAMFPQWQRSKTPPGPWQAFGKGIDIGKPLCDFGCVYMETDFPDAARQLNECAELLRTVNVPAVARRKGRQADDRRSSAADAADPRVSGPASLAAMRWWRRSSKPPCKTPTVRGPWRRLVNGRGLAARICGPQFRSTSSPTFPAAAG